MLYKIIYLIALLLLKCGVILCQDTIKIMDDVLISHQAKFIHSYIGNKTFALPEYLGQGDKEKNMTELLYENSGMYIKSNSVSGLATPTFRGMASHHTLFLWNGFPLTNITSGVFDINLLPNLYFSHLKIESGANSSVWGSGAIAGTVYYNSVCPNLKDNKLNIKALLHANTLQNIYYHLGLAYRYKKWISVLQGIVQNQNNIISFYDLTRRDYPLDTTNGKALLQSVLNENYFLFTPKDSFVVRLWHQKSNRMIIPLMGVKQSDTQQDITYKITAEYYKTLNVNHKLQFKNALFMDDIIYNSNSIYSHINTQQYVLEGNYLYHYQKHFVNMYNSFYYMAAYSNTNLSHKPSQTGVSSTLSYLYKHSHKYLFNGVCRQEFINNNYIITGKLAQQIHIFKNNYIGVIVSNNYRLPTINDLYWQPGGNPNLLPEKSFNIDVNVFGTQHIYSFFDVSYAFTYHHNYVNNWIIWFPQTSYWTPQNIQSVRSQGLTTEIKTEYKTNVIKILSSILWEYVSAKNETGVDKNKTLIYTPQHKFNYHITLQYHQSILAVDYFVVGNRFINQDNTEQLPLYQLINIKMAQYLYHNKFNLSIKCNNVFNTFYQSVAFYPMPMRYFSFSLSFNL